MVPNIEKLYDSPLMADPGCKKTAIEQLVKSGGTGRYIYYVLSGGKIGLKNRVNVISRCYIISI